MRTRSAGALILALIACAIPGAARADDKADIRALYGRMATAMKNKSVEGIMACGTSDFKTKENGQVMDAKQNEQTVRAEFATFKSVEKATMAADRITIKGRKATVISTVTMKATVHDPKDQNKTHTMAARGTSRDTLVKGPDGWKCAMMETLSFAMTLDGKAVKMDEAGGGKSK